MSETNLAEAFVSLQKQVEIIEKTLKEIQENLKKSTVHTMETEY